MINGQINIITIGTLHLNISLIFDILDAEDSICKSFYCNSQDRHPQNHEEDELQRLMLATKSAL